MEGDEAERTEELIWEVSKENEKLLQGDAHVWARKERAVLAEKNEGWTPAGRHKLKETTFERYERQRAVKATRPRCSGSSSFPPLLHDAFRGQYNKYAIRVLSPRVKTNHLFSLKAPRH